MAACSGCGERDGGIGHGKTHSRTGLARVGGDVGSVADVRRQAGSGRARLNWVSQGQRCVRCRVRRRAERVIRPARAKKRRLRVLVITICSPKPIRAVQRARLWAITCTASQVPRRHVVQPDAVLEVAYGVLDLGVAAVVGLQFQGLPVPVGDEAVIAVTGEEGQLGTGRGLHPPDDEPHRRGVGLTLEGGVGGLRHIGSAVHPVRNRRLGIFGYRLDEIVQAFVLTDGDGEADIHPAADGDHGVGIEAAVGPHRELSPGSTFSCPISWYSWAIRAASLSAFCSCPLLNTPAAPAVRAFFQA